jgi:hypothetical protein
MLGFVLRGTPTATPGVDLVPQVQLVVTSHLAREVTVPKERLEDPKYSLTATWMEGGTPIEEFRKVESIDGGPYGTLPLWLIRGGAYSYYFVVIQREGVLIEAALRSEVGVPKLKQYGSVLERLVRSIRIVKTTGTQP